MKKISICLTILFLSCFSNFIYAQSADDANPSLTIASAPTTEPMASNTRSVCDTKQAMRKLWEDHIVWTRNFIISALADLKDLEAVTARLLKNQVDIGNAIKPFYGDEAGNELTRLLRAHILIASKVVIAAKENNTEVLAKAQKRWVKNAEQIATFLSNANPNWNKDELFDHLKVHLTLTTKEVVSRLNEKWKADIRAYDKNHVHMLMFSDMLVDGIVKQFPEKFD